MDKVLLLSAQHAQDFFSLALFLASSCMRLVSVSLPVGWPVYGLMAIYLFTALAPSSRNACSTLMLFFALDSKKSMFPFCWQNFRASIVVTLRYSSRSTLLPMTRNGKVSIF